MQAASGPQHDSAACWASHYLPNTSNFALWSLWSQLWGLGRGIWCKSKFRLVWWQIQSCYRICPEASLDAARENPCPGHHQVWWRHGSHAETPPSWKETLACSPPWAQEGAWTGFLQTPSFLTQKRPSEWGVGTSEGLMWSWTARRSQQVLQEMVDTKKHCSGCVSQPPPIPPVPPAPPSMPCRHPNCASAPAPLPGQHKCSAHKQHRPACNASTGNQPISQAPCSWRCPRKLPKPAYSCPQRSPHWTHLSKCPSCSQRHRRSLCRCSAAGFFCPCPRWGSHWSWH